DEVARLGEVLVVDPFEQHGESLLEVRAGVSNDTRAAGPGREHDPVRCGETSGQTWCSRIPTAHPPSPTPRRIPGNVIGRAPSARLRQAEEELLEPVDVRRAVLLVGEALLQA